MKLTAEEIESHVFDTEKARAGYVAAADVWEKMWTLQLYDKTPKQVLLREGREQVTLPTPTTSSTWRAGSSHQNRRSKYRQRTTNTTTTIQPTSANAG